MDSVNVKKNPPLTGLDKLFFLTVNTSNLWSKIEKQKLLTISTKWY